MESKQFETYNNQRQNKSPANLRTVANSAASSAFRETGTKVLVKSQSPGLIASNDSIEQQNFQFSKKAASRKVSNEINQESSPLGVTPQFSDNNIITNSAVNSNLNSQLNIRHILSQEPYSNRVVNTKAGHVKKKSSQVGSKYRKQQKKHFRNAPIFDMQGTSDSQVYSGRVETNPDGEVTPVSPQLKNTPASQLLPLANYTPENMFVAQHPQTDVRQMEQTPLGAQTKKPFKQNLSMSPTKQMATSFKSNGSNYQSGGSRERRVTSGIPRNQSYSNKKHRDSRNRPHLHMTSPFGKQVHKSNHTASQKSLRNSSISLGRKSKKQKNSQVQKTIMKDQVLVAIYDQMKQNNYRGSKKKKSNSMNRKKSKSKYGSAGKNLMQSGEHEMDMAYNDPCPQPGVFMDGRSRLNKKSLTSSIFDKDIVKDEVDLVARNTTEPKQKGDTIDSFMPDEKKQVTILASSDSNLEIANENNPLIPSIQAKKMQDLDLTVIMSSGGKGTNMSKTESSYANIPILGLNSNPVKKAQKKKKTTYKRRTSANQSFDRRHASQPYTDIFGLPPGFKKKFDKLTGKFISVSPKAQTLAYPGTSKRKFSKKSRQEQPLQTTELKNSPSVGNTQKHTRKASTEVNSLVNSVANSKNNTIKAMPQNERRNQAWMSSHASPRSPKESQTAVLYPPQQSSPKENILVEHNKSFESEIEEEKDVTISPPQPRDSDRIVEEGKEDGETPVLVYETKQPPNTDATLINDNSGLVDNSAVQPDTLAPPPDESQEKTSQHSSPSKKEHSRLSRILIQDKIDDIIEEAKKQKAEEEKRLQRRRGTFMENFFGIELSARNRGDEEEGTIKEVAVDDKPLYEQQKTLPSDALEKDSKVKQKTLKQRLTRLWRRVLFKPKSPFKVKWDILIIFLSVINSITIPFEFAFPKALEDIWWQKIGEYFIDFLFCIDILVNFRTCYVDTRTDELVRDTKKIARNYLKGRFWIDLLASLPLEILASMFFSDENQSLKIFGMLKLVRLLRLGRIVTYLQTAQTYKFGAMFVQLLFMLLLLLHWMACLWFVIVSNSETWIPSKDLDWDKTIVFEAANSDTRSGYYAAYTILFYYAALALLGNDFVPSNALEVAFGFCLILVGTLSIGVLIGQFSSIISDINKRQRAASEKIDSLNSMMTSLKIPEEIQHVVAEYYNQASQIQYVKDESVYEYFSPSLKATVKLVQIEEAVRDTGLMEPTNFQLIQKVSSLLQIQFYLPQQVIVKQGAPGDQFFLIVDGLVEVVQESGEEFRYFDFHFSQNVNYHRQKEEERKNQIQEEQNKRKSNILSVQDNRERERLAQVLLNLKDQSSTPESGTPSQSYQTSSFTPSLQPTPVETLSVVNNSKDLSKDLSREEHAPIITKNNPPSLFQHKHSSIDRIPVSPLPLLRNCRSEGQKHESNPISIKEHDAAQDVDNKDYLDLIQDVRDTQVRKNYASNQYNSEAELQGECETAQGFTELEPIEEDHDEEEVDGWRKKFCKGEIRVNKRQIRRRMRHLKSSVSTWLKQFQRQVGWVQEDKMQHTKKKDVEFAVVNELKNGNYFGEICLMTNLKRTATILAVSNTTLAYMSKPDFKQLCAENYDLQDALMNRLNEYKDKEFKFMMTMIRNVPQFRTLKNVILRGLLYVLRERYYTTGSTILRKGELCSKSFFIKSGKVEVYVKETVKGVTKMHYFATLTRGSCFNFTNSFMGRPSLFDFVVKSSKSERERKKHGYDSSDGCHCYELEQSDFVKLSHKNETLKNVSDLIKTSSVAAQMKYDFQRMIFGSIYQLIRAQKIKESYLDIEEVKDLEAAGFSARENEQDDVTIDANQQRKKNASIGLRMSLFFEEDRHFGGGRQTEARFLWVRNKFKILIQMLKDSKFNIKKMKIFKIIDQDFDKFSGYSLNVSLATMLYCGKYSEEQKETVSYYLKKRQKRIRKQAAYRTILTGKDHLTKTEDMLDRNIHQFHRQELGSQSLDISIDTDEVQMLDNRAALLNGSVITGYSTNQIRTTTLAKACNAQLKDVTLQAFSNVNLMKAFEYKVREETKENDLRIAEAEKRAIALMEEKNNQDQNEFMHISNHSRKRSESIKEESFNADVKGDMNLSELIQEKLESVRSSQKNSSKRVDKKLSGMSSNRRKISVDEKLIKKSNTTSQPSEKISIEDKHRSMPSSKKLSETLSPTHALNLKNTPLVLNKQTMEKTLNFANGTFDSRCASQMDYNPSGLNNQDSPLKHDQASSQRQMKNKSPFTKKDKVNSPQETNRTSVSDEHLYKSGVRLNKMLNVQRITVNETNTTKNKDQDHIHDFTKNRIKSFGSNNARLVKNGEKMHRINVAGVKNGNEIVSGSSISSQRSHDKSQDAQSKPSNGISSYRTPLQLNNMSNYSDITNKMKASNSSRNEQLITFKTKDKDKVVISNFSSHVNSHPDSTNNLS